MFSYELSHSPPSSLPRIYRPARTTTADSDNDRSTEPQSRSHSFAVATPASVVPAPHRVRDDVFYALPGTARTGQSKRAEPDLEAGDPERRHTLRHVWVAGYAALAIISLLSLAGIPALRALTREQHGAQPIRRSLVPDQPPWTTHPAIIAAIIAGFLSLFGALTWAAYALRRARDTRYAAAAAPKFATQLHVRTAFPRLARAAAAVSACVAGDDDDAAAVRDERRADARLRLLAAGLPAHLRLGHVASASAPDLLARAVSDGGVCVSDEPPRLDVPIVSAAEVAEGRGWVSAPGSVRAVSPLRRLSAFLEEGDVVAREASRTPFLDLYMRREGDGVEA